MLLCLINFVSFCFLNCVALSSNMIVPQNCVKVTEDHFLRALIWPSNMLVFIFRIQIISFDALIYQLSINYYISIGIYCFGSFLAELSLTMNANCSQVVSFLYFSGKGLQDPDSTRKWIFARSKLMPVLYEIQVGKSHLDYLTCLLLQYITCIQLSGFV